MSIKSACQYFNVENPEKLQIRCRFVEILQIFPCFTAVGTTWKTDGIAPMQSTCFDGVFNFPVNWNHKNFFSSEMIVDHALHPTVLFSIC